jgi:hypothetical protein
LMSSCTIAVCSDSPKKLASRAILSFLHRLGDSPYFVRSDPLPKGSIAGGPRGCEAHLHAIGPKR